ncbi:MAG: hypothetical protein PHS06_01330 [Candidatus Shapirobacteria bacterium]|nr:hypothetical protein [Candidatus Shapirobacteria bacterium]
MNKPLKNIDSLKKLADLVLLEDVASMVKNKDNAEKFSQIPEETYRFALKKSNRKFLVQSALKSLQKTDSKATPEQAEALADMLHIFAKMLVFEVDAIRKSKKAA